MHRVFPQPHLILSPLKKGTKTRQLAFIPPGIRLTPNRAQIVLAVSPNRSDECHDRNSVKEKPMSDNAIDSENTTKAAPDTAKPKGLTARPKAVIKNGRF
jgi:hypothetical protein